MDEKTLQTLDYPTILERLATYCAFDASRAKAMTTYPSDDLNKVRRLQAETSEAVQLLAIRPSTTIGGARDVRSIARAAERHAVLEPDQILDVKYSLIAARNLRRFFGREGETYPRLSEIALRLPPSLGLVDAISRTLSDRGEVLNSASDKLAEIRRDLRVVHDRLLARMERMVSDPKIAPYLQENLVTQRDGRYVILLRAEHKSKVQSVVHDQSASGATLFVEPLGVVDLNNQYRELQLAERDEVRRVLAELSQFIGEHTEILVEMVTALADLDLALARAQYAEKLEAVEPILRPISASPSSQDAPERHPGSTIRLIEARHPLLAPEIVVPIDVELDPQTYALVITGPNTGGKTVTLKTVGLLALMAQSGMHIPAQSGSQISLFENVFADIGDEQSIEQSLSTFSSHINNIIRILELADRSSLVLLDELGAGTDPQEGSALARALLTHLLERGITTLVTTHHPELKAYAHAAPGVLNASVEFDLETLQPTYHLTVGLPGRSNALAIADRLGLRKEIVEAARSELSPTDLQAEDLLAEIHRQRDLAREARRDAEKARREAEEHQSELAARLDQIEDERLDILEQTRAQAREEVEALREEFRAVRTELKRARQPLEVIEPLEEKVEELEEEVEQPVERRAPEVSRVEGPIRLGSKVRLRSLGNEGVVTALGEEEAEVQIGQLRVRTRLAELELQGTQEESEGALQSEGTSKGKISVPQPESPGVELDLRGQRAEEARESLEGYLDRAYLSGLPWVRIIHGKGTGKLRQVVRRSLGDHPHVQSFEPGKHGEGGEGVTVAKIRD